MWSCILCPTGRSCITGICAQEPISVYLHKYLFIIHINHITHMLSIGYILRANINNSIAKLLDEQHSTWDVESKYSQAELRHKNNSRNAS